MSPVPKSSHKGIKLHSVSLWMNGQSFSHSSSGHLCWFWTGVKIRNGKTPADITIHSARVSDGLQALTAESFNQKPMETETHKVSKGFPYSSGGMKIDWGKKSFIFI